jgi:predicted DNA-binding transcriptional regulator YafY
MLRTVLRTIEMLRLIPGHPRKIAATDLHRRLKNRGFNTTLRTIQRDLNHLSKSFPIGADDHKPQGWYWAGNAVQFPTLDLQTALTLKLVEQFLRPTLPAGTLRHLEPHFRAADEVLSANPLLARWPLKVRFLPRGMRLRPPKIDPEVQAAVYEAVLEEKQLDILYRTKESKGSRRHTVHPLGIVVRENLVYLVCTFRDYEEVAHLPLNRIQEAVPTDEKASRPRGFSLDRIIEAGYFGYPVNECPCRLRARFAAAAARHLEEAPLSEDQRITQRPDGWALVQATVADTWELRWWLRGFGSDVEVLGPARLRNEFRKLAGEMVRAYR